jgi:moderate conductance mechanosensitive channel
VQDLLDRLGTFGLEVAGRLVTVALVIATLLVVYAVVAWSVRHVAARAALAPLPGEDDLADPDRALRVATRQRRLDTLVLFLTRLTRGAVVVLGGLSAVAILVPELLTALGSLGVALGAAVGAALGFGAQQLVRDYLNGILILSENPFSVGDVVAVAGVTGTIEEIGLRRTVLRDVDGTVHSVPNGEILVASNFTRTFARVRERFVVAAGTDIARATAVLGEACDALASADGWSERFIEGPRVLRVDAAAAGEPGIPILVTATVRPGEQWEVAGELRRRAIDGLRAAGIDLAAGRMLVMPPRSGGPPAAADGEIDAEADADFT